MDNSSDQNATSGASPQSRRPQKRISWSLGGRKTSHVVVLGGGFGGLAVTRALVRPDLRVTLIDRRNHHLCQPLLYQVATASLAPSDIAEPIRSIVAKHPNAIVRLAEATQVDLERKRVCIHPVQGATEDPTWVDCDDLVIALGVQQSWFGHPCSPSSSAASRPE